MCRDGVSGDLHTQVLELGAVREATGRPHSTEVSFHLLHLEESASRAFCNSVFVKAKYLYHYIALFTSGTLKPEYLYHYIALFKSGTLKPDRQYLARLLSSGRYAHAASFNPRVFRGVSAVYVIGACGAGCGFDCCLCLPVFPVLLRYIYTDFYFTSTRIHR